MADPATAAHQLVLARHAKAGESPGGGDRSRPLTDKGHADAAAAGAWLAQQVPRADAIWSSSAVRARQTAEGLAAALAAAPELQLLDDLYDAGARDLIELVAGAPADVNVLVVVGHNPTVEVAHDLLTEDRRGFRPGAVSVIELAGAWSGLTEGSGTVREFWSP